MKGGRLKRIFLWPATLYPSTAICDECHRQVPLDQLRMLDAWVGWSICGDCERNNKRKD
jgi:hypothetical protein